ncbi:uncharacterized protein [Littorina saxatilis]|uniref:uncharacterized protein n=1 Tax=Littorina saxatilis TaxID=31220 RepID=UPI0038B5EABE
MSDVSLGSEPYYVNESKVGIVGAGIEVITDPLSGSDGTVTSRSLSSINDTCQKSVGTFNPTVGQEMHDCEGIIPLPSYTLRNGYKLCVVIFAKAGGYYKLRDADNNYYKTVEFDETRSSKRVCFKYDTAKPTNSRVPMTLSKRVTRSPAVDVTVSDWKDPIPEGRYYSRASGIEQYRLEVHSVDVGISDLSVDVSFYQVKSAPSKRTYECLQTAIIDLTITWQGTSRKTVRVTLPEDEPRLYALILEVHDRAGNVAYARRLIFFDSSSSVELMESKSLYVVHANPSSKNKWQTDVSKEVCANWTGRFYNTEMYHNNFLMPVRTDNGRQIYGRYDQTSGLLPVSGTPNVKGVITFEISWRRDQLARSQYKAVPNFPAQSLCLDEPLKDGETYDIWIRATDIMGNTNVGHLAYLHACFLDIRTTCTCMLQSNYVPHTQEDSVRVSIDHTGPYVSVLGLQGRWGRNQLYVHNNTDLSTMTLMVHALDPHSGLLTVHWKLGTSNLADDVGKGAVAVQRLDNSTDCDGKEWCYCPSVGVCEIYRYLITFPSLVHADNHVGDHHRDYYVTFSVTNVASLRTDVTVDILLDESPPTVGVVWEGLGDDGQAEMDFTSNEVVHVRWHGFKDHESGVMMYRVVMADRCRTAAEMDAATNATEVDRGTSLSLTFPSEGHFVVSVVAYNGAMEPSEVAYSDGIIYDTSPPKLLNVSITHARVGLAVGCTQQNQPWLVNQNLTRVRLNETNNCLEKCSGIGSAVDVEHFPMSSDHVLESHVSYEHCQKLPKMAKDSHIALPSDNLQITWVGYDAESEMEEYYVGIGSDLTTSSAPDLQTFTPTHGHNFYHARHLGLGQGDLFYVFLQAVSKAGLRAQRVLGPIIIDVTPPDATEPLTTAVEMDEEGGRLVLTWENDTFVDFEQPEGVELQITFRVGRYTKTKQNQNKRRSLQGSRKKSTNSHKDGFVTAFAPHSDSLSECKNLNASGCISYPLKKLYVHDRYPPRSFFFQLHVINAVGHVTTVNSSFVCLPAHLPPSLSVVKDVIRLNEKDPPQSPLQQSSATTKNDSSATPPYAVTATPKSPSASNFPTGYTTLTSARSMSEDAEDRTDSESISVSKTTPNPRSSSSFRRLIRSIGRGNVSTVINGSLAMEDDTTFSFHSGDEYLESSTTDEIRTDAFSGDGESFSGDADSSGEFPAFSTPTKESTILAPTCKPLSESEGVSSVPVFEVSDDVDAILQRQEICVQWSEQYKDHVRVEVGLGTAPDVDDIVQFTSVKSRGPPCLNIASAPLYTKLFSVVKATSTGGTAVFSSDGFVIVQKGDSRNEIQVFNGNGCKSGTIVGEYSVDGGAASVNLTQITRIPIHVGDVLFVHVSPFLPNITFSGAEVEQETLHGYQIVTEIPDTTILIPEMKTPKSTLKILGCQKDATLLPLPELPVHLTWEIAGKFSNVVRHFKVEFINADCTQDSLPSNEFFRHQCLLHEENVNPMRDHLEVKAEVFNERTYVSSVSACFDDGCLPPVSSRPVLFSSSKRAFIFHQATILSHADAQFVVHAVASIAPLTSGLKDSLADRTCVARWSVSRDKYGSTPLTDWLLHSSPTCADVEIKRRVSYKGTGSGGFYLCLQLVFPWKSQHPSCHKLHRPLNTSLSESLHIIEMSHITFRENHFDHILHSKQLGSKLHDLYDLDIDFARSDVLLAAILTDSAERSISWFLMTNQHAPPVGNCAADVSCVTSQETDTGSVVFPRTQAKLRSGRVYYVCVLTSSKHGEKQSTHELCGDGVAIDDTSPERGLVVIDNANNGYLGDGSHLLVTWSGFWDIEVDVPSLPDDITVNYSVALGSLPGSEDHAHFVEVGQRTTWLFDQLDIASGVSCVATVRAQDRVGHVTESWSAEVIVDNTPPTVGLVAAGTISPERFLSGHELAVFWEGVEDKESSIESIEVSLSDEDGGESVAPFTHQSGNSASLSHTANSFADGHSYVVQLRITNRAGLTTLKTSDPFVVDNSPPIVGVMWNSGYNTTSHKHNSYSADVGVYTLQWTGFVDPHSGVAYFRVGMGSRPQEDDVIPFVYVGLQTYYTFKYPFDQGRKYYATLEVCNHARLCSVTSSESMTFDNSPPTPGHVTVGFDGRHSKFLGHSTSVPAQWTGFSDPQTGVAEFTWCVGESAGRCDVTAPTHALQRRSVHSSAMKLPLDTPLYVTVRARNPGGLETVSVSDSFVVDPTPPEVVSKPHFLSPRDGTASTSQWDRSVLCLAWRFSDPESSVVTHTVYIRSNLTGRFVTDPVYLGPDEQLSVTFTKKMLLADGDSHWATVSACNSASLCVTATSDVILVDSSPPFSGTFESPLSWSRENSTAEDVITSVKVSWRDFKDPDSAVNSYLFIAGSSYNGEDMTNGEVTVPHVDTSKSQTHTLILNSELTSGDVIYFSLAAVNKVGLLGPIVRMAFEVLFENADGTSGSLLLIRHSCDVAYCTKECTCSAAGKLCDHITSPCNELNGSHSDLTNVQVVPYIGSSSEQHLFTTSAKCLEGHWRPNNSEIFRNISRFEWSFSLEDLPPGEGIFDPLTESVWHDVGRHVTAVHCMPGSRMLESGLNYILHVRIWITGEDHVSFTSQPVRVDHSPPIVRRGKTVLDSDVTCKFDEDYVTTEPTITACWGDVFYDLESAVVSYEVWLGTSSFASNHKKLTDVGLNTTWTFTTTSLETGTSYYVTVRARNEAGLQTTAVSDGFLINVTPPVPGVAFPAGRYRNRHAQSSTSSLTVSWYGFEDMESGVASYYVALHDEDDVKTPIVPFTHAGIDTEFTKAGLTLEHNHSYVVSVKARDAAGLESKAVVSPAILVDVTPPEGVTCLLFALERESNLTFTWTSAFLHDMYTAELSLHLADTNIMLNVEVGASGLEYGAKGYVELEDLKMPFFFRYAQSGNATAQHSFLAGERQGNTTLNVVVEAPAGAEIHASLYVCSDIGTSPKEAIIIHQLSQYSVSMCARIVDRESGIQSIMMGIGKTAGGLQIQPWTPVGHSGHMHMEVHVQHGTPLYATALVKNHAGQRSRFVSQPISFDRTAPEVGQVTVSVFYRDEKNTDTEVEVEVEAHWAAVDEESGVVSCLCDLDGHSTVHPSLGIATKKAVNSDFTCLWQLHNPQHGSKVRVSVTCVNKVQIQTTVRSLDVEIVLEPPQVSQVAIKSLSNNALMSPFDTADPDIRSSNSSLEFCWQGINDPSVTNFYVRFRHGSRALVQWFQLDAYKTSAVLHKMGDLLPKGEITAELRAVNVRNMTSRTVSKSVQLDDLPPLLTGNSAVAFHRKQKIQVHWRDVFHTTHDVTFSVFAGTAEGYGDVINHVTTKATSYVQRYAKPVNSLFVCIRAVYTNGLYEMYEEELTLN